MPELPDVAVFQGNFEATSLDQTIESIRAIEPEILESTSPGGLGRIMGSRSFVGSHRHGKHLFARMDDDRFIRFHFGMTGFLQYFKDEADQPEHTVFRVDFENGYHLGLVMPRKLGAVEPVDDVDEYVERADLGPDVYRTSFGFRDFKAVLEGRRGMIKSTLMNQSVVAGLGNVYTDEILFQAQLHPKTPIPELRERTLGHIFHIMRRVIRIAIQRLAQPSDFPDHWLIPRREPGATCPRCGGEVERINVSGRNGYYCPSCQSKPGVGL